MKEEYRRALGGGGKLGGAGLEAKTAFEAAKRLGSQAAKVGRICQSDNEIEVGMITNENGEKVYDTNPEHNEKCSKTATSTLNGITCGKYAIQNVCPDEPSKTYWECLQ